MDRTLDQPAVLTYKEQILRAVGAQPTCERQTIAVDLTGPWKESLIKASFDPQRPSGWLLDLNSV
jgi:N-methyltransferase